jgi:hypothetical protein
MHKVFECQKPAPSVIQRIMTPLRPIVNYCGLASAFANRFLVLNAWEFADEEMLHEMPRDGE